MPEGAVKTTNISVENLLSSLIAEGLKINASDIHFEPGESSGRVRYRVDGLLETGYLYSGVKISGLIARLKLLSDLNITKSDEIQEGLLEWLPDRNSDGNRVEFRISVMPTVRGEKAVLRHMADRSNLFSLNELGFVEENLKMVQNLISKNQGLIFVSGPTGSGKTTTLFACLQKIIGEDLNVITLEDPVEIYLKGVNQIHVNTAAGESFADQMRAVLRQDPDVIMLGEIRDVETAAIAVRAALTGHLVLTTIHTLDAPGVIIRLREMGIPSYLIAETLLGAIAQRLIRRLCSKCLGEGCANCGDRGYLGRTGLQEVLPLNEDLRRTILAGDLREDIRKVLTNRLFRSLRDDGIRKVNLGITDKREVRRVLG